MFPSKREKKATNHKGRERETSAVPHAIYRELPSKRPP